MNFLLSIMCLLLSFTAGEFIAIAENGALDEMREKMLEEQIVARGITDKTVLDAMSSVKRHLFVPENLINSAYSDCPLPIGYGQTISQPYIVAYMTEQIQPKDQTRVLEIGTGCGYQAAVLGKIVKDVYSVEILKPLADSARERLKKLGYDNVHVKYGDGYKGWEEYAPFDAIVITAAPPEVPEELIDQLKIGGKMIVPVGSFHQELCLIEKTPEGVNKKTLLPVRFVPMVHSKQDGEEPNPDTTP
ncbi:MAG: protein-L-isoaspartate(D-aspartate) O-methyltransferase [Candidatus Omnitrophica bacterium]|nr:protein-L-isoaspartate(D-aspartate) O-methyltransferase [Candidatus Omnitrophota bacterium]